MLPKKLTALAALWATRPDELRADLQQVYGIDIDGAMGGLHTAEHVAALAVQLPHDSRVARSENPDAAWRLEHVLLALLVNSLRNLMWGMGDRRKRGPAPKPIGPSWLTKGRTRSLDSRVLPVDKLMEELKRPRRG